MKIENVVLAETSELLSARLGCSYAGDGDGGGWPAYRLHVEFLNREMTLPELLECIKSLDHFLNEICIMDENEPIFMSTIVQRFNDQFEKEKT